MALDETAKKENIKGSIRKYFVDNIARAENKRLYFDKSLEIPMIQGAEKAIEWVSVNHGHLEPEQWSLHVLNIHCCTREDPEGVNLSKLRDIVMDYLTDTSMTDGLGRIPFYNVNGWTLIGSFLVTDIVESDNMEAPDETKFVTLTCDLRFASKV
jgi:hypothetical protein